MTVKHLEHYEVVASMYDGLVMAGICQVNALPQLEYMDTLCIFEDAKDDSCYTEIRTRDIARLRVKLVLSDDPKEPAQ